MYDTYDCDITIYNAQYDRKVGDRVWRRMQISGVSFYGGQQVTVSDSGLSTAGTRPPGQHAGWLCGSCAVR